MYIYIYTYTYKYYNYYNTYIDNNNRINAT